MTAQTTSIDLYNRFMAEHLHHGLVVSRSDMTELLDVMKEELIVSGRSPLFQAAYHSYAHELEKKSDLTINYVPINLFLPVQGGQTDVASYDGWIVIFYLDYYLTKNTLPDDIEKYLVNFLEEYPAKNPDPEKFLLKVGKIDKAVLDQRAMMYEAYQKAPAKETQQAVPAETEKEKEAILNDARQQAEEEKQHILQAARDEADAVIRRAHEASAKELSAVQKRIAALTDENHGQRYRDGQQKIGQEFEELRAALVDANRKFKKLEDAFSETSVVRISTQYLELFNLIADFRDSVSAELRDGSGFSGEQIISALNEFLDMIVEYLADYGIRAIAGEHGDSFSSRYQTALTTGPEFDPRTAIIKVSKRIGFCWGEQVLQKERVEIE